MAHRDIIVVGASLRGPDALTRLVSGLTPDLPAAVPQEASCPSMPLALSNMSMSTTPCRYQTYREFSHP